MLIKPKSSPSLLSSSSMFPHFPPIARTMWTPSTNTNNTTSAAATTTTTTTKPKTPSFSSSNSSSSATSSPVHKKTAKSMEDVWKDIHLTSLQNPTKTSKSMVLKDFLTNQPTKYVCTKPIAPGCNEVNLETPATVLSLNSVPDFQFLDNPKFVRQTPENPSILDSIHPSLDDFGGCSVFPVFEKNVENGSGNFSGDRRFERMMKNREAAARSRARKQAYTNELERELAQLLEENAKLKRLQQLMPISASSVRVPKKKALSRTLTAPF